MSKAWDPRGGPDPNTKTPRFKPPPGACDCHVHIFGPGERFPFTPSLRHRAFDAPRHDLETMHARIGMDRCVIVHGATHGTDLSVTLEALASNRGRYRAVALVEESISDARLAELHDAGVRGIRYNFMPHLGASPTAQAVRRMADRVKPLGWHFALHMRGNDIVTHAETVRGLPVPLLFDHMARIDPANGGTRQAPFDTLLDFLEDGNAWVKIAAIEKISRGPYPFDDAIALAAALVAAAPDRAIWGSDWPHPDVGPRGPANDGDLVDLIPSFAPDPQTQRKLLVDNPARLYGF